MPVSGSLSFCCAWFAAGVLTAFPVDAAPCAAFGAVVVAPRLLPVVPWLRAFEVLGPGPPPVPLRVLPFDRVLPVEPVELPTADPALAPAEPPPAAPPALCASAMEQLLSKMPIANDGIFIAKPPCGRSVALEQFAPIGFVPRSCTLPGTITDVRRLSRNSQGDFMKTILMQHEMAHTLEDRSGVRALS
jgi:hypothetical protein